MGGEIPYLSAIMGLQVGFRGGERSAITVDLGYTQGIAGFGKLVDTTEYSLIRVHLMLGYKIGFIDRTDKKKEE